MYKGATFWTHICEFLNILWPSRAEHKSLPVWSDLTDNLANLRLKTHVKHAVSFVHDEVCYTTKVGLLGL